MLKAYIVEDERRNREFLGAMITDYCSEKITLVGSSGSVIEAAMDIHKLKPEVLFLDIELSDGKCFELLDMIDYKQMQLIFTTGYSEYAIKAIKYGALDYLLKPISILELKAAVTQACDKFPPADNWALNEFVRQKNLSVQNYLMLQDRQSMLKVFFHDIYYFEADGSYTNICINNHPIIVSSKNIGYYEDLLPPDMFFRCHKSYLLNLNMVARYEKATGLTAWLFNGKEIPVSVRKKDEFKKKMKA